MVNIHVPNYESKPTRPGCRADGADPGRVQGAEARLGHCFGPCRERLAPKYVPQMPCSRMAPANVLAALQCPARTFSGGYSDS